MELNNSNGNKEQIAAKESSNRQRRWALSLTSPDKAFLNALTHQKIMTVRQAKALVWKDYHLTYVYKRILQMRKEGLLQELRTGSLDNQKIFFLTRKGLALLGQYGSSSGLSLPEVNLRELSHDLLVTDIRIKFHEMGLSDWISERSFTQERQGKGIPDGAFLVPTKGVIGIELELSQKRRTLYYHHFRHLFDSTLKGDPDLCFYFVRSSSLKKLIEKEAKEFGGLYVGYLDEFLEKGYGVTLTRGEFSFPLEKLRGYVEA